MTKSLGTNWNWKKRTTNLGRNGLAVAEHLSRAGDVVGDVLGARAGVHHFRRAPGFCQQRADESCLWANEFEVGGNRDWTGRGEQLLLVRGSGGSAQCNSTGGSSSPGAGIHVRLDQSGDRAGSNFVGANGLAVRFG
jgi:hypothetical protein